MAQRFIAGFLAILFCSCLALPLAAQAAEAKHDPLFDLYFWERDPPGELGQHHEPERQRPADSSAYLRLRTSLGAHWRPGRDWEVHLRLTNENRVYLAPKLDPRLKTNFNVHEVFFDQLNVRWRNPGRLPLTVTVGPPGHDAGRRFPDHGRRPARRLALRPISTACGWITR